jgi:predicted solute-binding protein
METLIDRKKIRKGLPHGMLKEVAKRAGVNQVTVSNYFAGYFNSAKVENAALEVYIECKQHKNELLKKLNEVNKAETEIAQ